MTERKTYSEDYERLTKEVSIPNDCGCVVFDIGVYLPYSNTDHVSASVQIGNDNDVNDLILDHRYLNRSWHTMTRTYDKGKSGLGYPFVGKFNELETIPVHINLNITEEFQLMLTFMLKTDLTSKKPLGNVRMKIFFDTLSPGIYAETYEIKNNKAILEHRWYCGTKRIGISGKWLQPEQTEDGTLWLQKPIVVHGQTAKQFLCRSI